MSAKPPLLSPAARGLRLGRAVVEAGAGHALERWAARGEAPAAGERASRVLLQALLELRGAALKVAQFLSLESDLLPPAALAQLAQASHRVPPMGPEFARHRLRSALGPVEQHFAAFDPRPFAAASLGQVHAATTHDGREVAVKLQYPGMAQSVRSDLRLLRNVCGLLAQGAHYRRLLQEVEQRLAEECDYVQEAQAQRWFAERLQQPGLRIATVLPALSTPQVLTSERLQGLHLEEWLATGPDQAVRDRAAQCLYDAFVKSMHVLGRLHADPNPGNLLFEADGSVALLDFGCTRWIPADVQQMVARIWRAAVQADDEAAHAVYREMGLFAQLPDAEAWRVHRACLAPFREWLAVPLLGERFDFGAQPEFVAEGRRRFAQVWSQEALVGIRPEFVLVNRTLYGLYRLFERMGARVRCQTAWTSSRDVDAPVSTCAFSTEA